MQVRLTDPLGQVRYDLYRACDRGVLRLDLPLAANDPAGEWKLSVRELLNDTEDAMLTTAIELEGHCYSRLRQSDDFKEGVEAFHAKRPPKFQGK